MASSFFSWRKFVLLRFLLFFDTESHSVAQAGLQLEVIFQSPCFLNAGVTSVHYRPDPVPMRLSMEKALSDARLL